MIDDQELINQVLEGNLMSFTILVKQYQNLVFSILIKILKKEEDAEDVAQEVFLKVYKHLNKFQFQSKLSTWIAAIAYSEGLNYLKKSSRNLSQGLNEDIDSFNFSNETPHWILEKRDLKRYVQFLVDQLPVQYKTVLTLFHLNEFSYQEIQQITGMPEGTIKGYLFRARNLLKTKIENHSILFHETSK